MSLTSYLKSRRWNAKGVCTSLFLFFGGAIFSGTATASPDIAITGAVYTYDVTETGFEVIPTGDASVEIYYDDADADPSNDVLVADADLGPGQQGQILGSGGSYAFTVVPGQYRIQVVPTDVLLAFPSQKFPVRQNSSNASPWGDVSPGGEVVAHGIEEAIASQRYFLRFQVEDVDDAVTNNYIPLDPIDERVSIKKHGFTQVGLGWRHRDVPEFRWRTELPVPSRWKTVGLKLSVRCPPDLSSLKGLMGCSVWKRLRRETPTIGFPDTPSPKALI